LILTLLDTTTLLHLVVVVEVGISFWRDIHIGERIVPFDI